MNEQMYSAEEAAQILGLQVRTVRNYLRDGRLAGVRIGKQYRIARADLDAFTAGFSGRQEPLVQLGQAGGPAPPSTPSRSSAEVSSVVQIDRIEPEAADRLVRTLEAASAAGVGEEGPGFRVEPLYDAGRLRMKVVIVGPLAEAADLLRIIDAFGR